MRRAPARRLPRPVHRPAAAAETTVSLGPPALEAKVESSGLDWTIRLPLRAEQVTIEKRRSVRRVPLAPSATTDAAVPVADTRPLTHADRSDGGRPR